MAAILPFLAGGLLFANLKPMVSGWRSCALVAAVVWGAMITFVAEGLGAAALLAYKPVAIAWAAIASLLAISLAVQCIRQIRAKARTRDRTGWIQSVWKIWTALPLESWCYLSVVACFVGCIFLAAILAPPNTWDSLTYHMPRVMHWIQNHSLAHYPTSNDRQLWDPPWCELAIAQFQILAGSDRLANLIQFMAMIVSLLAVSLVVAKLRGSVSAQVLAVVLVATLPMGILQASSTQTDWGVGCWTLCFLVFALEMWSGGGVRGKRSGNGGESSTREMMDCGSGSEWLISVLAGLSLGLALLSKGTAILYCAPLGFWLACGIYRRWRWRGAGRLTVIVSLALLLNAPQYARNWRTFGDPLSAAKPRQLLTNATYSAALTISNLIRNASIHLQTPWKEVNEQTVAAIASLHRRLGMDVNDPRASYRNIRFDITPYYIHEDFAGNPWHFMLSFAAILILGLAAIRRRDSTMLWYVGSVVAMCVLQSAILKWQPWNSRLQLPIFVCAAPLVAIAIWRYLPAKLSRVVAIGLMLLALPAVIGGVQRPLVGPTSVFKVPRAWQYYSPIPSRRASFDQIAEEIRRGGFRDIGLAFDYNDWEYPLWIQLNPSGAGSIHLRYVAALNPEMSTWLWTIEQPPEAIVVSTPNKISNLTIAGRTYVRKFSTPDLELFLPQ